MTTHISSISTQSSMSNYISSEMGGGNLTNPMANSSANETIFQQEEGHDDFQHFIHIFVPILFGIIAIVGTCGNLLVIVVVISNKQMRNSTNMLIINLALADLFFIIICVPFTAVSLTTTNWPFGDIFCKIYQYMINVTCYESVYTLVLMSLDRYLAVVHPIWSISIRTASNALYVIIISWVLILALTSPIIFEYGKFNADGGVYCTNLKIARETFLGGDSPHGRLFYGCFFFFSYLLPLTLVCVLYGFMLRRLLFRMAPGGNASAESMRGKKRVTKMIVIVVCIFAICWLPINIRFLIQFFGHWISTKAFLTFQVFATCIAYMNSCMNPILYAFLSENFRKSFRKLLCCNSKFQPMNCQLDFERTNIGNYKMTKVRGDSELTKSLTAMTNMDKNGNSSDQS